MTTPKKKIPWKDEHITIQKIAEEFELAQEVNLDDLPSEVMTDGKGNKTLDNYSTKLEEE